MRLGIDYGTAVTRAVVAWPDGRWTPLLFDGSPLLLSGVYVDPDRGLLSGAEAWQHGLGRADAYLAHPKALLVQGTVSLGGREVEVLDLVAATLRRVAGEAGRVGGGPVDEVTLSVPAWWGPARRTLLRRAATRAGLPQPRLVESPVAIATHLLAGGAAIPVGSSIVACDFGAGGLEAAVVRRTSDGFDVLSVIGEPQAAGTLVDAALADHLATVVARLPHAGNSPGSAAATAPAADRVDGRLLGLAHVRAARQCLTHSPAVAVPTSVLPVILDQPTLRLLAQPVLDRAAHTVRAALQAAEVGVGQIAGVFYLGGTAQLPWVAAALAQGLGVTPVPVPDADLAAVRGAVHAGGPAMAPAAPPTPAGRWRIRHYASVLVPAVGSLLLLLVQATSTALPVPVVGAFDRNLSVLADWGEYAIAALLVLHAAVAVAVLAAGRLHRMLQQADPHTAEPVGKLLGRFLPAAAATGLTLAGLYGITGALWYGVPNGPFLRWTLYPTAPTAIAVAAIGLLATRRRTVAAGSWLDWLTFPPASTALAAAGMYLIEYGHSNADPATRSWTVPALYLGAALLGVGTALAIPARLPYQVLATPPLALLAVVLSLAHATGTLAGLYIIVATGRWATRAVQLLVKPSTTAHPPG